jgi:hypothetical protein
MSRVHVHATYIVKCRTKELTLDDPHVRQQINAKLCVPCLVSKAPPPSQSVPRVHASLQNINAHATSRHAHAHAMSLA